MKRNRPKTEAEIARDKKLAESAVHLTSETAREYQKLGVEARRRNSERKRSMQDIAKWLGGLAVNYSKVLEPEEILDLESAKQVNMTASEALMLAQFQKALTGDTASAVFIRDTIGEKPKEEIEVHGMTMDEYAQKHKPKF